MATRHEVESGDQRDEALPGLERADVGHEQPVDRHPQCAEHGPVRPLGRLARREPLVVDAVRRDHHRNADVAVGTQPILRHLADAEQDAGVARRPPDGAAEEGGLGAQVPFRMSKKVQSWIVTAQGTGERAGIV